jgi:hypothetical protein
MATTTKRQTTQKPKMQFVLIDAPMQANNAEVLKAYTKITETASELLKRFDVVKYRTYCMIDHTKNETNANLVSEFLCHFWNITLSNSKEGKSYIFLSIDEDCITKFGNGLTNMLLRDAYRLTQSQDNTIGIEYALRVDFNIGDVRSYFYRRIVDGETDYVSIVTVDKAIVN